MMSKRDAFNMTDMMSKYNKKDDRDLSECYVLNALIYYIYNTENLCQTTGQKI